MRNPDKRRTRIVHLLRTQEHLSVHELSAHLKVSEVTIRKDLAALEESGLVMRTHGGARLHPGRVMGPTLQRHVKDDLSQKHSIARQAVTLVQPHDTLAIGPGTTTECLAETLSTRGPLTVVTNALNVALACARHSDVEVHLLGGLLRGATSSVVGPQAEEMLEDVVCDIAFLGVSGLQEGRGLMTSDALEASLHRSLMAASKKTVVLADASKFDRAGFQRIAKLEEVDRVITDDRLDPVLIERYTAEGVQVDVVPAEEHLGDGRKGA